MGLQPSDNGGGAHPSSFLVQEVTADLSTENMIWMRKTSERCNDTGDIRQSVWLRRKDIGGGGVRYL